MSTADNFATMVLKSLGPPSDTAVRLGVTKAAVSNWKTQNRIPAEYWRALSTATGIPIKDFCAAEERRQGVVYEDLLAVLRAGR